MNWFSVRQYALETEVLSLLDIQYNFIAKCQYNCTRNVLWCHVHSSHIHTNRKTSLNYINSKHPGERSFIRNDNDIINSSKHYIDRKIT